MKTQVRFGSQSRCLRVSGPGALATRSGRALTSSDDMGPDAPARNNQTTRAKIVRRDLIETVIRNLTKRPRMELGESYGPRNQTNIQASFCGAPKERDICSTTANSHSSVGARCGLHFSHLAPTELQMSFTHAFYKDFVPTGRGLRLFGILLVPISHDFKRSTEHGTRTRAIGLSD
jgi:hypothetical protein